MSSEQAQDSAVTERGPAEAVPTEARPAMLKPEAVFSAQLPLLVFKFGGSSLAGADCMLQAAALVHDARASARLAVVISAMRGVTDRLLSIGQSLTEGALPLARAEAGFVLSLHREVVRELRLGPDEHLQVQRELDLLGRDLLHEIPQRGKIQVNAELLDRLASFGERFSARLFAAALSRRGVPAVPVASSDFVLTSDEFGRARPDVAESKRGGRDILQRLLGAGIVPVVTGFIGATRDGRITTFGRNSSDYSGAIIAHILDANELVIWTDVDGIYTANPNFSPDARLLSDLTYDQAHALAASGAKVLHAGVLPLAAQTCLVVWVRNTFKPQVHGTRIGLPPASHASVLQEGAA